MRARFLRLHFVFLAACLCLLCLASALIDAVLVASAVFSTDMSARRWATAAIEVARAGPATPSSGRDVGDVRCPAGPHCVTLLLGAECA